jgi:uncharacterized phage protein (TIGR02220 family)
VTESKISDENYFQVTGWMLKRLNLKGMSLQIYAIIYGFSQDGESSFTGSLQYLCDFTNTSRPTVIKALKELVAKEYVIKTENEINGVKFNRYRANLQVVKNLNMGSKEPFLRGGNKPLPNNKDIDNELNNKIIYIVEYLNGKAGTKFRSDSKATVKLLSGLLTGKKPFSVEDCKKVIDNQCAKWKGTEWEQYLRPSTLFGTKFENYLNAKVTNGRNDTNGQTTGDSGKVRYGNYI